MRFLNIAGYQFVALQHLSQLRNDILNECQARKLKGTILLSSEGININLAGDPEQIHAFIHYIEKLNLFLAIRFHRTYSAILPFKRLKVKLKKEIITLRQVSGNPTLQLQAPRISPRAFKQRLADKHPMMLIDTRNQFEIALGTFEGAEDLHLNHFSEFPEKIAGLDKQQEIVLFCTGGIRCEKAALYMQAAGFTNVCQLDGGILGYFAEVGGDHYKGSCFVFDDRMSVYPDFAA